MSYKVGGGPLSQGKEWEFAGNVEKREKKKNQFSLRRGGKDLLRMQWKSSTNNLNRRFLGTQQNHAGKLYRIGDCYRRGKGRSGYGKWGK